MLSTTRKGSAPALVSLILATTLTYALPRDLQLEPRSGVSCSRKYEGDLYVVDLQDKSGRPGGGEKMAVTLADDERKTLTTNTNRGNSMRFQWDKCTAQGWDKKDSQDYGQLKPVKLADEVQCVTASTKPAYGYKDQDGTGPRELFVHPCSGSPDETLERQWFESLEQTDSDGSKTVQLFLTGNADDRRPQLFKPDVILVDDDEHAVKNAVAATAHDKPSPYTLVLRNVKTVS